MAKKFANVLTYSTVLRWYNEYMELKGIPTEKRYKPRQRRTNPRKVYEFEKQAQAISAIKREEAYQRRKEQAAQVEAEWKANDEKRRVQWEAMEAARERAFGPRDEEDDD